MIGETQGNGGPGNTLGTTAIFAIVRESYLPAAWTGTLRYRFAAMRVPSVA